MKIFSKVASKQCLFTIGMITNSTLIIEEMSIKRQNHGKNLPNWLKSGVKKISTLKFKYFSNLIKIIHMRNNREISGW